MKWMAWTSLLLYEGGNLVYYYSHSVTVCFQTPYLNSLRTYLDASYTAYVKCMHANKWQTAWTVRLSPPCSSVLVTQGIIARCLYIYIYILTLCSVFTRCMRNGSRVAVSSAFNTNNVRLSLRRVSMRQWRIWTIASSEIHSLDYYDVDGDTSVVK